MRVRVVHLPMYSSDFSYIDGVEIIVWINAANEVFFYKAVFYKGGGVKFVTRHHKVCLFKGHDVSKLYWAKPACLDFVAVASAFGSTDF